MKNIIWGCHPQWNRTNVQSYLDERKISYAEDLSTQKWNWFGRHIEIIFAVDIHNGMEHQFVVKLNKIGYLVLILYEVKLLSEMLGSWE